MSEYKGGCMCGAVQYELKSEPRLAFYVNAGNAKESPERAILPSL
jgi:hypothetical protein